MKKIVSTVIEGLPGVRTYLCIKEELDGFNYYVISNVDIIVYIIIIDERQLATQAVMHLSTKIPDIISIELGNFSQTEVQEPLKSFLKLCY